MATKSSIEWTDASWNPTTGCTKVSAGCDHCYAETWSIRMREMGQAKYRDGFAFREHPDALDLPLRWPIPKRIFVNSMSDLFHVDVGEDFLDRTFAVMALASHHVFQVLTKRPQRLAHYLNAPGRLDRILNAGEPFYRRLRRQSKRVTAPPVVRLADDGIPILWPLPNVWLGTSVENQSAAHRIKPLLEAPAAVRFLSCEPLLGPLDLDAWLWEDAGPVWADCNSAPGIDWVIVGGESGAEHRPCDPVWVRGLRDQCSAAVVPFFFKQWGGRTPKSGGRDLDGRTWDQMPPTIVQLANGETRPWGME